MRFPNLFLCAVTFAGILCGQQTAPPAETQGAPLQLVPSKPFEQPTRPARKTEPANVPTASEPGVRPAILNLRPAGDPIYLVEDPPAGSDKDKWRTYQRAKVDRFSRNGEGVAIQGYDVVSYHERRVEKGSKEFSAEYGGVSWRFATADHHNLFLQDPLSFVPEYGGFCTYSVARGYPATADPRAYVVQDRKLYLFFDKAVQAVWEQDQRHLVSAADRYWPDLHR
jgi:hypothetical protein